MLIVNRILHSNVDGKELIFSAYPVYYIVVIG
jgi:hypothetical protein